MVRDEITLFRALPTHSKMDPLLWWPEKAPSLPYLARLAQARVFLIFVTIQFQFTSSQ